MKKLLLPVLFGLTIISLTACKHPEKKLKSLLLLLQKNTDDISKMCMLTAMEKKIEVTINNTKNTATIHLNGKTFDLKKVMLLPEYTASNEEYQYSDIKGNITFLKKRMLIWSCFILNRQKRVWSCKMASY